MIEIDASYSGDLFLQKWEDSLGILPLFVDTLRTGFGDPDRFRDPLEEIRDTTRKQNSFDVFTVVVDRVRIGECEGSSFDQSLVVVEGIWIVLGYRCGGAVDDPFAGSDRFRCGVGESQQLQVIIRLRQHVEGIVLCEVGIVGFVPDLKATNSAATTIPSDDFLDPLFDKGASWVSPDPITRIIHPRWNVGKN